MDYLVDSNILLNLTDGPDNPFYHDAAAAVRRLEAEGHLSVIVPQNVYECWVAATRPKDVGGLGMSPAEADEACGPRFLRMFPMRRDERTIYRIWRQLVVDYQVRGKPTHDARLVAAMIRHGIKHILTFNTSDFDRYPMITVLNPKTIVANAGLTDATDA